MVVVQMLMVVCFCSIQIPQSAREAGGVEEEWEGAAGAGEWEVDAESEEG